MGSIRRTPWPSRPRPPRRTDRAPWHCPSRDLTFHQIQRHGSVRTALRRIGAPRPSPPSPVEPRVRGVGPACGLLHVTHPWKQAGSTGPMPEIPENGQVRAPTSPAPESPRTPHDGSSRSRHGSRVSHNCRSARVLATLSGLADPRSVTRASRPYRSAFPPSRTGRTATAASSPKSTTSCPQTTAGSTVTAPRSPVPVVLHQVADEREKGVGAAPVLALGDQGLVDVREPSQGGRLTVLHLFEQRIRDQVQAGTGQRAGGRGRGSGPGAVKAVVR